MYLINLIVDNFNLKNIHVMYIEFINQFSSIIISVI